MSDRDRDDLVGRAVRLVRACRAEGLPVTVATSLDCVGAWSSLRDLDAHALYVAARACCVKRPEDREPFDRAFAAMLGLELDVPAPPERAQGTLADGDEAGFASRALRSSVLERLGDHDLADLVGDDLVAVEAALDALAARVAIHRRRLARRAERRGRVDLRRTVARAHLAGGDLIPIRRRRDARPRRLVVLVDISGSMDPYVAVYLRLIAGLAAHGVPVEAFSMGTRLTRLTRAFATHDSRAGAATAVRLASDLAGGTRLGSSLASFNHDFGRRGLARGADVVIFSDGLDRGDPAELGAEVARCRAVAHAVVWVNPLKGTQGYEPLARGMRAALVHCDDFLPGHSPAALADLVRRIATGDVGGGATSRALRATGVR